MGEHQACGVVSYAEDCLPTNSEEMMCHAENGLGSMGTMRLPASNPSEAAAFLQGLGGDAAGTGQALSRVGVNAPAVRGLYKQRVESMVAEIARRLEG